VRISASRDLKSIPTTNTGLWCGQAAAAAVGGLVGLAPPQIAHAIAIAGMVAPSQSATPYTRFRGNNVKEGIPWGTANGILAASLAREGFTGPIDILDNPERYAPSPLLDGLGSSWHIVNSYFKPYSCCRWIHAPIDALLAMMAEHGFTAGDIAAVEVETFGRTLTLSNDAVPATLEAAQYSLPFCMGVAAARGAPALLPLTTQALSDTQALDVSRRVTMRVAPDLDAMFPAAVPGRVRVRTGKGLFERSVMMPKGEPANPMSWDDLDAKFLAIAEQRVSAIAAEQIRRAVHALRMGEIAPLIAVLEEELFGTQTDPEHSWTTKVGRIPA
jgi:2-methylcitrate dehydratase PrpD